MNDSIKTFYDSLTSLAEVQKLIVQGDRESATLEYKEAFEEWKDSAKKEIAKDVSAMANSEGGVIIYGVKTGKGADKTKPIEITGVASENTQERLTQIVNSNVRNEILGWDCKALSSEGKSVLVVSVPKSTRSPHQCVPDACYYFRSATQNLKMEHNLVELHFGRRLGPELRLNTKHKLKEQEIMVGDRSIEIPLWLTLKNEGKRIARDVAVYLTFPHKNFVAPEHPPFNLSNVSDLYEDEAAHYQARLDGVIYPETSASFAHVTLSFFKGFLIRCPDEPLMEWKVFADEMSAQEGNVTLKSLGLRLRYLDDAMQVVTRGAV